MKATPYAVVVLNDDRHTFAYVIKTIRSLPWARQGLSMREHDAGCWLLRIPVLGGPCLAVLAIAVGYANWAMSGAAAAAAIGAAGGVLLWVTGIAATRLSRLVGEHERRIAKLEKDLQPSEVRMG